MEHEHFEGHSAAEHLKAARLKGAKATSEIHGTEMPGSLSAAADSAKEGALLLIALWIILPEALLFKTTTLFLIAFFVWKVGRSALLGWSRLERLHRLIEQERWEIEHHRAQEKEELIEMYKAKGLKGDLLNQVVDIFMADDNRLLQVMLEEELGLTLESYEHPLRQACGAGLGVLLAAGVGALSALLFGPIGFVICLALLLGVATFLSALRVGNNGTKALVWTGAISTLALVLTHLVLKLWG